jgi:putative ABC transport system permease protein
MAIGITSVSLMSALGEGVRHYILQEFTQFGSHLIAITPGKTETFGMGGMLNTIRPLSLEDALALKQITGVTQVVPVVFGTAQVKHGERSRYTNVAGIGPQADRVWQLRTAQGRFLPEDDLESPRAFAVLGSRVKLELFGDGQALGQTLSISGARFRIIGILAAKGQFLGTDLDDTVYIPVARGLQLFNRESLMEIDIVYAPNIDTATVSADLHRMMRARHGVEDYTLITQDEVLVSLDKILRMIKYAAGGLGAISLLVGGIGIFTIMLITSTERTQEIGLLRALGFSGSQIRNLFLGEALLLALIGCGLGLISTAILVLLLHALAPQLPLSFTPGMIAAALVLSLTIGISAGVLPASRAAALNPIDALRFEP